MLLRTDDDVDRLRGVWLGPPEWRVPVDWTYPEWAVFASTTVVGSVVFTWAWMNVWGLLGAAGVERFGVGLLLGFVSGGGLGVVVRTYASRVMDSDRRFRYLAGNAFRAAGMLWWGHGPVDRALTAAVSSVTWFLWVLAPGPGVVRLAVLLAVTVPVGRRVRDRVESPQRRFDRTLARAARCAETPTVELTAVTA